MIADSGVCGKISEKLWRELYFTVFTVFFLLTEDSKPDIHAF